MASSFAQYPYQVLTETGSKLTTISGDLDQSDHAAYDVSGLTGDQSDISGAVSHFRSMWDESVKKLKSDIGSFAHLTTQIGQLSSGTDQGVAKAIHGS